MGIFQFYQQFVIWTDTFFEQTNFAIATTKFGNLDIINDQFEQKCFGFWIAGDGRCFAGSRGLPRDGGSWEDAAAAAPCSCTNSHSSYWSIKWFQLLEYQMVWNGGWVCRFDTLGQWPSPHSRDQCTLLAEALVMIPVVTALGWGSRRRLTICSLFVNGRRYLIITGFKRYFICIQYFPRTETHLRPAQPIVLTA